MVPCKIQIGESSTVGTGERSSKYEIGGVTANNLGALEISKKSAISLARAGVPKLLDRASRKVFDSAEALKKIARYPRCNIISLG